MRLDIRFARGRSSIVVHSIDAGSCSIQQWNVICNVHKGDFIMLHELNGDLSSYTEQEKKLPKEYVVHSKTIDLYGNIELLIGS